MTLGCPACLQLAGCPPVLKPAPATAGRCHWGWSPSAASGLRRRPCCSRRRSRHLPRASTHWPSSRGCSPAAAGRQPWQSGSARLLLRRQQCRLETSMHRWRLGGRAGGRLLRAVCCLPFVGCFAALQSATCYLQAGQSIVNRPPSAPAAPAHFRQAHGAALHHWRWRGLLTDYLVARGVPPAGAGATASAERPAILLCHGFGAFSGEVGSTPRLADWL